MIVLRRPCLAYMLFQRPKLLKIAPNPGVRSIQLALQFQESLSYGRRTHFWTLPVRLLLQNSCGNRFSEKACCRSWGSDFRIFGKSPSCFATEHGWELNSEMLGLPTAARSFVFQKYTCLAHKGGQYQEGPAECAGLGGGHGGVWYKTQLLYVHNFETFAYVAPV